MPILPRFPGGGCASGYRYQSRDVGGITYSRDAGGGILLKWTDPEDMFLGGEAISEWKGTIVVCKEGSAPQSVDDGVMVCDSTVRDQYRETGLLVDVGGPGHYYGIFPYTKDYVVNVDSANTVYILSGGYVDLESASWADIAYIAAQGRADQIWAVGDEKAVTLSGAYNGTIHVQIAGFGHDDLASGGKAAITFASKEIFTATRTGGINWGDSRIRNDILPGIEGALPRELRNLVVTVVKKMRENRYTFNYDVIPVEDKLFLFSLHELGIEQNLSGNREGERYALFQDDDNLIRKDQSGDAQFWWTRSNNGRSLSGAYADSWYVIRKDKSYTNLKDSSTYGICFGFCI